MSNFRRTSLWADFDSKWPSRYNFYVKWLLVPSLFWSSHIQTDIKYLRLSQKFNVGSKRKFTIIFWRTPAPPKVTFDLDPCDLLPWPIYPWGAFYDPKVNGHCKYHCIITYVFAIKKIGLQSRSFGKPRSRSRSRSLWKSRSRSQAPKNLGSRSRSLDPKKAGFVKPKPASAHVWSTFIRP